MRSYYAALHWVRQTIWPPLKEIYIPLRIRCYRLIFPCPQFSALISVEASEKRASDLRYWIKRLIFVSSAHGQESTSDLLTELHFLHRYARQLEPLFKRLRSKRVLFSGQSYYHGWYLSRALREQKWKAVLLNWDLNPASQLFYHGEDVLFTPDTPYNLERDLRFYTDALYGYDIYHFTNANAMCFGFPLQALFASRFGKHSEIRLLKALGKKIVYTNNGCMDGVSQTSFAQWGPESVCAICRWRNAPDVCSDHLNLSWGKLRNELADYQCLLGGNRIDYNATATAHEVPEVYCLDPQVWDPELAIPEAFIQPKPVGVRLYHAVGNRSDRTDEHGVNIKSSHIYLPLIEKLKAQGHALELVEPTGIPNKDLRFLQMQSDIFLDMLTYGWFGANAREAMMLGKPVICHIRPEWLESVRREIPEYADTLPVVDATPETVEAVLLDLIAHPEKRAEIGKRSRAFALKWHSSDAAARRFNHIYSQLLKGNRLLLKEYS